MFPASSILAVTNKPVSATAVQVAVLIARVQVSPIVTGLPAWSVDIVVTSTVVGATVIVVICGPAACIANVLVLPLELIREAV